jgi:hypothetical protein
MQNDTFVASAVKVTAVNAGAFISMAADHTGTASAVAGTLAAVYSVIQIIKSLPWLTDYFIALRSGFMQGNWSHWRGIVKRTEKGNDNGDNA